MNDFEKQQILNAFKRCFGLEESLKHLDHPNKNYTEEILNSLSYQSGLRRDFIEKHIEEIRNL